MVITTTRRPSVSSLKCTSRICLRVLVNFISHSIHCSFHQTQTSFRASLCDSFNTPEAIIHLRDLVSRTNVYINSQGKNLNIGLVENVARWVGEMLGIFGLGEGKKSEIGWGQEGTGED